MLSMYVQLSRSKVFLEALGAAVMLLRSSKNSC
jgi:hypothetical protein